MGSNMNTKSVSSVEFLVNLRDDDHPLHDLSSITHLPLSGWEEEVKRKGMISEIIRRLTKAEEDIRKLQTKI